MILLVVDAADLRGGLRRYRWRAGCRFANWLKAGLRDIVLSAQQIVQRYQAEQVAA